MKTLCKYILILVIFCSFKQDSFKNEVVKVLTKASNLTEVKGIFNVIKNHNKKIPGIKKYIPTIAPINPKKTKRLSSLFGNRFHPIDGKTKKHLGLDISAPYGAPVHATANGFVKKVVNSNTGYGRQVYILHGFGFKTRYAHLEKYIVKQGQRIKKGDIIGFVGSTGKSTGSHLHYEVIKNKKHLDPQPFCFLKL